MAEARPSAQPELGIETFISCAICLDNFTRPKLLPCLHAFCADCLQTYVEKFTVDGTFPCPECRKRTHIAPDGLAAFKDFFFMNSLMDFVLGQASSSVCSLCALDKTTVPAISKCIDCSDYLCQSCTSGHHKSRQTRGHQVVKLDDIKLGKVPHELQAKTTLPCTDHPGEHVRYYCVTCEKLICRDCQVLGHKTHECEAFDVAAETRRKILVNELNKLETVIVSERQMIQEEKESTDELTKIIQATSEQLVSLVQQKTKEALENLQPTVLPKGNKINNGEESSDISQLERYGQSLKMLLKKATDVEILDTFSITQSCAQGLSQRKRSGKDQHKRRRTKREVLHAVAKEYKSVCLSVSTTLKSSRRLKLLEKISPPAKNCGYGLAVDCIGNIYTCGNGKAFFFGPNKTWRDISSEIYDDHKTFIRFVTADGRTVIFLHGEGNLSSLMTVYDVETNTYKTVDLPRPFQSPCACAGWEDTFLMTDRGEKEIIQVSTDGSLVPKCDLEIRCESDCLTSITHNSDKVIFVSTYKSGIAEYEFESNDDVLEEMINMKKGEGSDSSSDEDSDKSNSSDEESTSSSGDIRDLTSITCIRFDKRDNLYTACEEMNCIMFTKSDTITHRKVLGEKDGILKPVEICIAEDKLLVYHEKGLWIYHMDM